MTFQIIHSDDFIFYFCLFFASWILAALILILSLRYRKKPKNLRASKFIAYSNCVILLLLWLFALVEMHGLCFGFKKLIEMGYIFSMFLVNILICQKISDKNIKTTEKYQDVRFYSIAFNIMYFIYLIILLFLMYKIKSVGDEIQNTYQVENVEDPEAFLGQVEDNLRDDYDEPYYQVFVENPDNGMLYLPRRHHVAPVTRLYDRNIVIVYTRGKFLSGSGALRGIMLAKFELE